MTKVAILAGLSCGLLTVSLPAAAAKTGTITGRVDHPDQVTAVTAINRENDKKYAGRLHPQTGRFTIDNLPVDVAYDCVIDLAGARLEGVNLKVPRSDYEEEQPLSKEDVEAIKSTARSLNKFEDRIEVLAVEGNIQHAAVLLNKLRAQPFYGAKPDEVIWRLELWHFEKPEETWIKDQEELFLVLYRERLPKGAYAKKSLTLDPALGGLRPTAREPTIDLGRVVVPAKDPGVTLRPTKK